MHATFTAMYMHANSRPSIVPMPDVDVQRPAARERVIGQHEAQGDRDDDPEQCLEVDRVDR